MLRNLFTVAGPALLLGAACARNESVEQTSFGKSAQPLWLEQPVLSADNTSDFGRSVAAGDGVLMVGAATETFDGIDGAGAVHVFGDDGGDWVEQQLLTAPDSSGVFHFGQSLAISGDTAVVGAYSASVDGVKGGAAYVFERSNGSWSFQQKLASTSVKSGEQFGWSVAISGDTILIGDRYHEQVWAEEGRAFFFERDGTSWNEVASFGPTAASGGEHFGTSVAILGDRAVVGCPDCDLGAFVQAGTVGRFVRSGGVWNSVSDAGSRSPANGNDFGQTVGLGDATMVVTEARGFSSSRVWVSAWGGAAVELQPSTSTSKFGSAFALSGKVLAVGASSGSDVFVYQGSGASWSDDDAFSGSAAGSLGMSVALFGDLLVAGAPSESGGGRAHVYLMGAGAGSDAGRGGAGTGGAGNGGTSNGGAGSGGLGSSGMANGGSANGGSAAGNTGNGGAIGGGSANGAPANGGSVAGSAGGSTTGLGGHGNTDSGPDTNAAGATSSPSNEDRADAGADVSDADPAVDDRRADAGPGAAIADAGSGTTREDAAHRGSASRSNTRRDADGGSPVRTQEIGACLCAAGTKSRPPVWAWWSVVIPALIVGRRRMARPRRRCP
jgi:hypothetical protein